jgi:hypothetical protein
MWWNDRFLIHPDIAIAIARGEAHLGQETDPVRRLELKQLLDRASRGVPEAVNKLWALGPAPAKAEIYEKRDPYYLTRKEAYQEQQRENAAAGAVAKVRELYNSLKYGDPTNRGRFPLPSLKHMGLDTRLKLALEWVQNLQVISEFVLQCKTLYGKPYNDMQK